MAMIDLKSIFSKGAEKLVSAVGDAFDKNFTNKEEKEAAKLEMAKEINRHFEAVMNDTTRQTELENQDRASARGREAEFVKATGHIDYLMWFLAISAIGIFGVLVYTLLNNEVPVKNEMLIIHTLGIIEGIIVSLFSYYFGSSAGSRIKDMKPK